MPPHHSQLLYQMAHEPKDFWSIPDSGHIQALRSADVRKRLAEFLQRHSGAQIAHLSNR